MKLFEVTSKQVTLYVPNVAEMLIVASDVYCNGGRELFVGLSTFA